MNAPRSIKRLATFIGVAFCAFTTLFIFSNIPLVKSQAIPVKASAPIVIPVEKNYAAAFFSNIPLKAKAAYVFDVSTNQPIFAKNETTALPYASLTKVMTMLVADETVPQDTVVSISKTALAQDGDSGLTLNEQWRLKDLMDFSLMVSSNDGAEAVGEATDALINRETKSALSFPEYMNQEAKKVGMVNTTYLNANGLDINTTKGIAGATGSAKDMATLMEYVLKNKPDVFESTKLTQRIFVSLSGKTHIAGNTDLVINQIPNLIASKTGYTLLAGGNLAIAFDAGLNEPIIIVLLGSTENGRFTDMLQLASSTQAYLTSNASTQFIQLMHAATPSSSATST